MSEQLHTGKSTESSVATNLSGGSLPQLDRAQEVVNELLGHPLIAEAFQRLQNELPQGLRYHNFEHTADVLYHTVRFALADNVKEHDVTLLGIAAAWHDVGFIKQMNQNELIAAAMVREAMERGGFFESDIKDVETAILDTQLKLDPAERSFVQRSTGRLSPWLLDADLSNFGKSNFIERSAAVYGEIVGRDITSPADFKDEGGKAFIAGTIRLLYNHEWHSAAARAELAAQEQVNLKRLGIFLAQLTGGTEASLERAWEALRGRT